MVGASAKRHRQRRRSLAAKGRSAPKPIGQALYRLVADLYPLCRSITGSGVRETLSMLRRLIELKIHQVPSGTEVFDWTVPKEWNIRDAYIRDGSGKKIVDFKKSNLHIVGYSAQVHTKLSLAELKKHLFTSPEHPDWIPYRTSYYEENWGFCLSHRQLSELRDGEYEVCIDASMDAGFLSYGECYLEGELKDEILVSCHICHPSLANDNLSGIAVAAFLAKALSALSLRFSYRFLFVPGTIGPITWLCFNEERLSRIRAGLVLACLGDSGGFTYKKSRQADADIDRAVVKVLQETGEPFEVIDFSPYGYDERQFCSPAFNLPVGCLMRTPHGRFPEYHTSADNLSFVRPERLADSFITCLAVLLLLENNKRFINLKPKCEPQLGKRGLYAAIGGGSAGKSEQLALLWVLNMSDGRNSLLDIAGRSGLPFSMIRSAAQKLGAYGLLEESR